MTIKDLKPTGVWSAFHSLTQIPRPSGHTEAVAAFLVDFANSNGAKGRIDDIGNVIMEVEATPGYENAKTVILQAHMDMVPQKTPDSKHNFETDPIETWIDGDWLKAKSFKVFFQANNPFNIYFNKWNEDPEFKRGNIRLQSAYMFGVKCNF